MDALAEIWSRSGQRSEDLYEGTTDEIIKELKAWIVARNVRNETNMRLLWDFFDTNDAISGLQNQSEYLDDLRIAAFKAKHVKSVERVKEFKEERDKLTLRASYLLSTLSHRGLKWTGMPCTPAWTEMDSEVCAFLKTKDRRFDAEKQLEILEMEHEIAEWRLEHARREAVEASRLVGVGNTNDQNATPRAHRVALVGSGGQEDGPRAPASYSLPALVDVTGLLPRPRPRAEDNSENPLLPGPMDTIEEELNEEETAEAIAREIDNMETTEESAKVGKKSKAKIRDARRKKARVRAMETAKAEEASKDDVVDKELSDQMSKASVSSPKNCDE